MTPVSENVTKVSRVRIPCQLNNAFLKQDIHLFIIFQVEFENVDTGDMKVIPVKSLYLSLGPSM